MSIPYVFSTIGTDSPHHHITGFLNASSGNTYSTARNPHKPSQIHQVYREHDVIC